MEDLPQFGLWFEHSGFPDAWVLEHLEKVIRLTNGAIEGTARLLERLDEIMPSCELRVLACVRKLVEGDPRGWSIAAWRDPLRSILAKGLQSADHLIRESALDSVHYLGSRGFRDFRELLTSYH